MEFELHTSILLTRTRFLSVKMSRWEKNETIKSAENESMGEKEIILSCCSFISFFNPFSHFSPPSSKRMILAGHPSISSSKREVFCLLLCFVRKWGETMGLLFEPKSGTDLVTAREEKCEQKVARVKLSLRDTNDNLNFCCFSTSMPEFRATFRIFAELEHDGELKEHIMR